MASTSTCPWIMFVTGTATAAQLDGLAATTNPIGRPQACAFHKLLSAVAFPDESYPCVAFPLDVSVAGVHSTADALTSNLDTWNSIKSSTAYRKFSPIGGPSTPGPAFRACLIPFDLWEPNLLPTDGDRPAGNGDAGTPLDIWFTEFFYAEPLHSAPPVQAAIAIDTSRLPRHAAGSQEVKQAHQLKQLKSLAESPISPALAALRRANAPPNYEAFEKEVADHAALVPASAAGSQFPSSEVPIIPGSMLMLAAVDRALAPGGSSSTETKALLKCIRKLIQFVQQHLFGDKFRLAGFQLGSKTVPFGPATPPGIDTISFPRGHPGSRHHPDQLRFLLDALRRDFREVCRKQSEATGAINPFTLPQGMPQQYAFGVISRIHDTAIVIASHSKQDIAKTWMSLIEQDFSPVDEWYPPGSHFRHMPWHRRDIFGEHICIRRVPDSGHAADFSSAAGNASKKPVCFWCGQIGHTQKDKFGNKCQNPKAKPGSIEARRITDVQERVDASRRKKRKKGPK